MATIARSARSVGLGAAITLHVLLLVFIGAALRERPRAVKDEGPLLRVRLLPWPAPAAANTAPARLRHQRAPAPRRVTAAPAAIQRPSPPQPIGAPGVIAAPAEVPLLDSNATRRAIAQAARAPSRTASSAQERLGREIARAAHGDCLKGDYAGGGMGLLSLPFWIAAELRDKCRR